jgi:hypothetical protein
MSRQTVIMLAVLLLTFCSGVAAGLYFGGGAVDSPSSTKTEIRLGAANSAADNVPNDIHANVVLSTRIRELEKQLELQRSQDSAATLDRVAYFKKYGSSINMQPFDSGMTVTPEMAALLGLTAIEKRKVEQDLAEAKGDLTKLEDADTKMTSQTDHSVSYEIAADQQGAAVKQKLHDLLADDLGDDRADVFVGDGKNWSYNTVFSGFLDSKRQIDLSWTTANGTKTYTTVVQSGTGTYSTSSSALPQEYQKYLPADPQP